MVLLQGGCATTTAGSTTSLVYYRHKPNSADCRSNRRSTEPSSERCFEPSDSVSRFSASRALREASEASPMASRAAASEVEVAA